MKKEIMRLVKSESGEFRINNVCILRRWTKSAIGFKVDKLQLEFDCINDVRFGQWVDIKSRDYEGIISEIDEQMRIFFDDVYTTLGKQLRAGYRNTV